jgi:hypothetical protein
MVVAMRRGTKRLLGGIAVGGAVLLAAWALDIKSRTEVSAPASSPPADDPEAAEVDHTPVGPDRQFDRRFWLSWFLPLMAITVACIASSVPLFFGAFPGTAGATLSAPTGGILFLIDAKAGTSSGEERAKLATKVKAETWTTGFDGADMLSLKLEFPATLAGARWYIAASGQYFPDQRLDTNLFCDIGFRVVREPHRIRCQDTEFNGSTGVEYRYDDQIGSTVGDGKIWAPINSLAGYEAKEVAVLTGVVSAWTDTSTQISIPFRTPQVAHPGGDDLVRLAPIGVSDDEWGSLHPVRDVAAGYTEMPSEFADVQSGEGLRYLPLSTVRIDVREESLEGRQITTALPPTSGTDHLLWEQEGQGIGPILYRIHDPASETDTAVNAFLAGLIASTGTAALLLLVEQVLVRLQKT